MENFKDILNSFKERFSNPLIFSFACSWLVFNWQVVIALFWFDTIKFQEVHQQSIFQFVTNQVTTDSGLMHPFLFALAYTVLAPIFRNFIKIFYSWCFKWGEKINLKVIGEGMISAKKYIQFKENYDKRTTALIKILADEEQKSKLYESKETELLEVKQELGSEKIKNQKHDDFLKDLRNVNMLNGRWKNTYKKENGVPTSETVTIEFGKYIIDGSFGAKEHKFDIKNLYYDNNNKDLVFVKEVTHEFKNKVNPSEIINFNSLKFESKDRMVGTENGTTKIEYTRI